MKLLLRSGCTSRVAPRRSRATTTGICSSESPRLAALPPRRRAGLARPATLEGLEDKGLIGFDDPRKALGLVVIERGEKSMSPPEGGARVDLASLGRLGEALPLDEGSPLIEPAVLVVQAGDRGCWERIEGLATLSAAAARQAPRAAPPSNLGAAAVRAAVSGEADFGDVRERRAPARRRRFFPSLALQIAGGAKAVSLSSCETSAASASARFRNARPRCAAVSDSTAGADEAEEPGLLAAGGVGLAYGLERDIREPRALRISTRSCQEVIQGS
jgi:hypothetical protein